MHIVRQPEKLTWKGKNDFKEYKTGDRNLSSTKE